MPLQCTKKLNRVSMIFKFTVAPNSLADIVDRAVNALPNVLLAPPKPRGGRPSYAVGALLKIFIYAYGLALPVTGRQLQRLIANQPTLRWFLSPDQRVPSYRTLNRFRVDPRLDQLLALALDLLHRQLLRQDLINPQVTFVDGTKLEAVSQKYTFVWRKAIQKNNHRLNLKIQALLKNLRVQSIKVPSHLTNLARALAIAQRQLHHRISRLNRLIAHERPLPGGSPNKRLRRTLKHALHLIETDYLPRKRHYLKCLGIFEGRNSFAKTDHDATFMRLKDDPMRNGQLKPAYNLQITTAGQYILAAQLFRRPGDQRTLMPFVRQTRWTYCQPRYLVADSGYASEPNYHYLMAQHRIPLIPYTMYEKEKTRKYRRDPNKLMNWQYDAAKNLYVSGHGVHFKFWYHGYRTDHRTGYTRHFDYYRAEPGETPEQYYYAHTHTGRRRYIGINVTWEKQKAQERDWLTHDPGQQIYAHRKDEVETAFANIKRDLGFRRFHVYGLAHTNREIKLVALAYDLRKYTKDLPDRA